MKDQEAKPETTAPMTVIIGLAFLKPKLLGAFVVKDAMTESERAMQDRIDAVFALGGLPAAAAMLFEKLWQPSGRELTRRWETGQYRTIRPNSKDEPCRL